ncbi:acetyltransferase, gnat family protein [Entophlyctis helioformis]|nr:acetyltransferase, gnat family protein [Entophlyctis helioformis]
MIRPVTAADRTALVSLGLATGVFEDAAEVETLLGETIDSLVAGSLPKGHQAHVMMHSDTGEPTGWVYFGPHADEDGVWELWWIGVAPDCQRNNVGASLIAFVEATAAAAAARQLIVNTSSGDGLAKARAFYTKHGYARTGQIPDYYGQGQDQVTFTKRLVEPN